MSDRRLEELKGLASEVGADIVLALDACPNIFDDPTTWTDILREDAKKISDWLVKNQTGGKRRMNERKEKFTPGPWFVAGTVVVDKKPDSSSPGIYHWDPGVNPREICDASSTFDIEDYDEQYANACLMSAAPEMYELLREIYERPNTFHFSAELEFRGKIEAVLKKARGEE